MIRHITLGLGLALAAPAAALAQATEATAATEDTAIDAAATYEAARNQLGILQYCEAQGFSGPEAVAAQGQLIALIPAGDTAVGDAAQQAGAAGTVAVGETQVPLSEAVASQGSTVEATCQQIEAAVNQVVASLPG